MTREAPSPLRSTPRVARVHTDTSRILRWEVGLPLSCTPPFYMYGRSHKHEKAGQAIPQDRLCHNHCTSLHSWESPYRLRPWWYVSRNSCCFKCGRQDCHFPLPQDCNGLLERPGVNPVVVPQCDHLDDGAVGNALSSGKSRTGHCEFTKCARSVRLSPIASGAASNSSTGRCRRLTQKVG